MFDEVTCEEFYYEDEQRRAWMDELELDWVNGRLQVIAAEQKAAQVETELDAELLGA